jgi:hypothetical protein
MIRVYIVSVTYGQLPINFARFKILIGKAKNFNLIDIV